MTLLVVPLALGCGDGERRTVVLQRVVSPVEPACGAPAGAQLTVVTALGDFEQSQATFASISNRLDQQLDIDSFPPTTRTLEITVSGGGGNVLTVGRTREFDFEALENNSALPVFMAPPRGFCPVGALDTARIAPLAAATSAGVLVAGGTDENGIPIQSLEMYQPDAGRFVAVAGTFYGDAQHGLIGATLTTLHDGRVVAAGGHDALYQLFNPTGLALASAEPLDPPRAHHAAVALPDGRLLLIGGCGATDDAGACTPGSALATTSILDVDFDLVTAGPDLEVARIDPMVVIEADGRVLVSGGVDDAGDPVLGVERLDPQGDLDQEVTGASGTLGPVFAGGTLVTYPTAGDPTAAWIVPPGATTASPVSPVPTAHPGATLTPLEDGKVLSFGDTTAGAGGPSATLYLPFLEGFDEIDDAHGASGFADRTEHAAIPLDDGSVLIVGGRDPDGSALSDAWIYRHDLTGPWTSELQISLAGTPQQVELLSPRDPGRASWQPAEGDTPGHYRIDGSDRAPAPEPSEWAIATGPHFVNPRVLARVGAFSGGVALLLGVVDAGHFSFVELQPGQPARFHRVSPDYSRVVCTGQPLADGALTLGTEAPVLEATVEDLVITVWLDSQVVLECSLDQEALTRGMVGIGVIGDTTAAVRLDSLSVGR